MPARSCVVLGHVEPLSSHSQASPEAATAESRQPLSANDSWSHDPVRMYLTQMGEIPLLSRQEEISLAKTVEVNRAKFRSLMLQTDLSEQLISRDVVDAVLVAVNAIAMPFVLVLTIVAAITKKERKSGDKTLRENLAAGRARAGTEVEMGESPNPLADVADEE